MRGGLAGVVLLTLVAASCAPTTAPATPTPAEPRLGALPVATPVPATSTPVRVPPTVAPRPPSTPTPAPAPPTPAPANRLQTFRAQVSFDTYEVEENVQYQLGLLPGVVSIVVTQLDVTVQYDPTLLTEADILRALRANPEVRIKDDQHADH